MSDEGPKPSSKAGDPPSSANSTDDTLTAPFTRLGSDAVVDLLQHGWGIEPTRLERLATERDDSYVVTARDGRRGIVKIAHPLDDLAVLGLQCTALLHASDRDPGLPLPRLIPDLDGGVLREVVGADGEPRRARLLSYLDGATLDYDATSAAQRRAIGRAAGRLSLALSDLEHGAARRVLAWDLQQVGPLRALLGVVADQRARGAVEVELDAYGGSVGPALRATRQQVVHNDLNADNLLVDVASADYVTGILDFGDVVHSSVVGDLAVAMAYAVGAENALERDDVDPWVGPYDIAAGFAEVRALEDDEVAMLPALVRVRLAQRLVLNSWLAASDPANAGYTGRSITRTSRALQRLAAAPSPLDRVGG
jgi:Ser/Thr protein kinase RdoA (MazF antagonist)